MLSMRVRNVLRWQAFLICCWLLGAVVWGSEDVPLEVAPDRPDVTNSTQTVPVGAFRWSSVSSIGGRMRTTVLRSAD